MGDIRADMPAAPATSRAASATFVRHTGSGRRTADTDVDRALHPWGQGCVAPATCRPPHCRRPRSLRLRYRLRGPWPDPGGRGPQEVLL